MRTHTQSCRTPNPARILTLSWQRRAPLPPAHRARGLSRDQRPRGSSRGIWPRPAGRACTLVPAVHRAMLKNTPAAFSGCTTCARNGRVASECDHCYDLAAPTGAGGSQGPMKIGQPGGLQAGRIRRYRPASLRSMLGAVRRSAPWTARHPSRECRAAPRWWLVWWASA